jgi:signal transduction histidine kinase
MQETLQKQEQIGLSTPPQATASQSGTAIQLGLSHLIAGAVALGLFFLLAQLHVQQPYALLIALAAGSIGGFLCTLNLQYSLYLLELTLSRLAHGQWDSTINNENHREVFVRRWPLGPLFLRLQEIRQRIQHYVANELLTSELREKALQQAREAAAQSERNRIARELHDSIKQQIFSMSVSAATLKALGSDQSGPYGENAEDARKAVEDIQRSAREAHVEMQALLQQLRPAPLENSSLVEALHVQAQALGFRTGAQVYVELAALPDDDRLLPGTQEAIFRMVQEAFANIARHARARTIWLALHTTEQALRIEIRDDGQGFDTANVRTGMGLNHLHERAQELHGSVEVSSQPGQGTTVLISIPLLESSHGNPEEEARQHYELARANEQATRAYQLCSNASFLSIVLALAGILASLGPVWGLAVLGGLLVSLYGYASGVYYRTRVALSAGRESRAALELAQHQHRVRADLTRLAALGVLYALNLTRLSHTPTGRWLLIGAFICLLGLVQFARWRYYRDTDRYFGLLSSQELSWELERRGQIFTRSLTLWGIISIAGLISAHSLFVLPPLTLAQQNAYGLAIILLLVGASLFSEYVQVRRWKQRLSKREANEPLQEKEK